MLVAQDINLGLFTPGRYHGPGSRTWRGITRRGARLWVRARGAERGAGFARAERVGRGEARPIAVQGGGGRGKEATFVMDVRDYLFDWTGSRLASTTPQDTDTAAGRDAAGTDTG